jgi:hypothetical protein
LDDQITDLRKNQITIQEMLQKRTGYPWEERDPALWDVLWSGNYLPMIVDFPLVSDPGTRFEYSNLTSDWLGMIVARACDTDLKSYVQEHLFPSLGVGARGQLIVLVDDLDMVIVTITDPLNGQTGQEPRNHKKEINNLVAEFIASLPGE